MKVLLQDSKSVAIKYLQVDANVRYWDDATINGEKDDAGSLVPFKEGDSWKPLIDLENGIIFDWPNDVEADFCFKVCDAGDYYLLDENKKQVAMHNNFYVPDGLLCYGNNGYGDYIIMQVNGKGEILNYSQPHLTNEHWDAI